MEKNETAFPRSPVCKIRVVIGIISIATIVMIIFAVVFTRAALAVFVLSERFFSECKKDTS